MEDGCVDLERSTHVGIHGSMSSADLMQEDQDKGWLTITMDEFVEKGPVEAANIVKERIGEDTPTIISFDVDVLEPGECPGIGFPEPGDYNNNDIRHMTDVWYRRNEVQGAIHLPEISERVECDWWRDK